LSTANEPNDVADADVLARSEARLRAVLSGMLDGLITINAYGTIQDLSDSAGAMFGYSTDELLGQNIKLLMPEPHRSNHDDFLAHYRETGSTWILGSTREFEVLRKDGTPFPVELSVARIDVPDGGEPLFCGSFRDITERKANERRLEESEARFRAIFNQEFQFVGLLRPNGTILEINQTALTAAGIERDTVIGMEFWKTPWWSEAVHAPERLEHMIARAAGGELVREQIEYFALGAQQRLFDFSLKPVYNSFGSVIYLIAEGRDITELKRSQERESDMQKALATVGESAAILAHEIKNPITAVNLALRAVADKLGENEEEVLQDLVRRMQTLEGMIRRTLSFVKPIDSKPELIRPAELAEHVAAHAQRQLAPCHIELELPDKLRDVELQADPLLLGEVLTNLLHNAREAIEGEGTIWIKLVRARDGHLRLSVEDDGPGVPASMRDEIFRPFYTTKSKGNGIGLALSRRIMERHGGTLQLDQSAHGGARFYLDFPVAASGLEDSRPRKDAGQ